MNLARDQHPVLTAIPLGMAVFDQEGGVAFASDCFLQLFESLKTSYWRYTNYLDLLLAGTMKQELRRALESGQVPLEGYLTLDDGRTLHFRHDSMVNNCPGLVCRVEDVTQKMTEIRIGHVLRDLVEKTVDGIGMADTGHRGFFVNQRLADTLGVSQSRLEEERITIEDVQPHGVGPYSVHEALKKARDHGSMVAESRLFNLESQKEHVFSQVINAHTDLVEDRPIYSSILRDISELHRYRGELEASNRKLEIMLGQSESELQQRIREVEYSQQLWRSIVEHQLNLVVIASQSGEILFANRLVEGVGGRALCGRHLCDLVAPEYRQLFSQRLEGLLNGEEDISTFEAPFVLTEDIRFTGLASLNSFTRLDGQRVLTMLVADITESLRDRERLLESQKFAATGRMAAKLAHEINNPLAGIKSALSIIQTDLDPEAPSSCYLTLSMRELDRVGLIIRQLYGLYRPQQETITAISPLVLVKDCIMLLDARLRAEDIEVRLAGGEALTLFGADNGLRQVLFNVLGNAIEACGRGGEIALRILRLGSRVAVAVRDNGEGLGGIDEDSIFEAFFSTKQSHDGAGLGLGMAVSRGLMRAMGGDIRIRNRRCGRGALCVLFLPATPPRR